MSKTTKLLSICFLLFFGMHIASAQTKYLKWEVLPLPVEKKSANAEETPLIPGLPPFSVGTETSLRTEADHRSEVIIRLKEGMTVEVLDPISSLYWTKVRINERIGWAKKACLDPESGEIDYSYLDKK